MVKTKESASMHDISEARMIRDKCAASWDDMADDTNSKLEPGETTAMYWRDMDGDRQARAVRIFRHLIDPTKGFNPLIYKDYMSG